MNEDTRESPVETGLFWLSSRYYSPELCRFISPDDVEYLDPESVNGLNLYCYCYNDPINYCDPSGNMAIATIILLVCIGVGATIGSTYAGVTAYNDGARGWELVGWTALGAVVGGAVGGLVGSYAGPMAASFLSSGGFVFAGVGGAGLTASGALAANLVVTGAIGVTYVGALAANGVMMFAKTSKKSGKETSSEKPSWFNESMVDPTKTPQQNATDVLNWKYDPGNWSKGPKTEYNQIVKWIERYLRYYRGW